MTKTDHDCVCGKAVASIENVARQCVCGRVWMNERTPTTPSGRRS